jgi:hypothetical protein
MQWSFNLHAKDWINELRSNSFEVGYIDDRAQAGFLSLGRNPNFFLEACPELQI